jgi:PAS domain S-box-containing protein
MDELLNNAPCGFLIFTQGKITEANVRLLEILGYERGELVSLPVEKIFSVAGRIFYQTHFYPLLKLKNKIDEVYLSLRTKNGEDIPVMVNAVRRERDGQIYNDCVFFEMKQRDQYENELLQAKKEAEAATLAKNEFLQVVSHELRTPLTAIVGWAQILESGKLDPAGIKRASETIKRSVKAQSQLIEDILDYARITAGKMRLEVMPVDLEKIAREVIELIAPAASAKEITIETDFHSKDLVSADPSRLQQVLWNLLLNAIKFTPKGGRVTVKLERINSHVEISVSDTGKGISAELLPFVFDRMTQADDSKTGRSSGLGLGLAIVRHIVELHGGTIRAESSGEGSGATFTVSLQVRVVAPKTAPPAVTAGEQKDISPAPSSAPRLDGVNILVVDDHPEARELLRTVLSIQGAKVTAAADVLSAVRIYESEEFDLVISDIEMPNEDGFSLIEKLNAVNRKRQRNTPAIALTAQAGSLERIKILSAGFKIHLSKPIEPTELITVAYNFVGLGN